MSNFTPQSRLTDMAKNILKKRYYAHGEHKWKHLVKRNVDSLTVGWNSDDVDDIYNMFYNRYFLPNSPTMVNAGMGNEGGLSACYVLPFGDTIEDIIKTKGDFFHVARKGGGAGTTLSDIRPKGDKVNGSTHGYAGGPIAFADTISHDMEVISQGGFRSMALMFCMKTTHPDILEFITAKSEEGKIPNANISVMADDKFMQAVINGDTYWTEFNGKKYEELNAIDVFNKIVDNAWALGDPGILFYNTINDSSPYRYAGITIEATNPCGEQPLVPGGSCNLGALDLSKFFRSGKFDMELFERAIRLGIRFLDSVIDNNFFPTREIEHIALLYRPLGLGLMGWADYCLKNKLPYGSNRANHELEIIGKQMKKIATDESEILGTEKGIPDGCKLLPIPRRNMTLLTIAPTGTTSLIAGCNSGIEPYFSDITQRKDKTGEYTIKADESGEEYFKCAVPSDGNKKKEVTWMEHITTQASIQRYIDSGVSKTINFPQNTRRETIAKAYLEAWRHGCKGITVYRNGSRNEEVLTPKNMKKNLCPVCGSDQMKFDGCIKCSSPECDWALCL